MMALNCINPAEPWQSRNIRSRPVEVLEDPDEMVNEPTAATGKQATQNKNLHYRRNQTPVSARRTQAAQSAGPKSRSSFKTPAEQSGRVYKRQRQQDKSKPQSNRAVAGPNGGSSKVSLIAKDKGKKVDKEKWTPRHSTPTKNVSAEELRTGLEDFQERQVFQQDNRTAEEKIFYKKIEREEKVVALESARRDFLYANPASGTSQEAKAKQLADINKLEDAIVDLCISIGDVAINNGWCKVEDIPRATPGLAKGSRNPFMGYDPSFQPGYGHFLSSQQGYEYFP